MKSKANVKRGGCGVLAGIALISFINPNIHVFDILPDFIGAFIIAKALSYLTERVPYFGEAKLAFIKLGLVSMLRIPAFFVMTSVRSTNVSDNDIVSLFALVFGLCEGYFFITAIHNLFSGLYYLGQRSATPVLLRPYGISKKSRTESYTPEKLKNALVFFAIFKLSAALLPELLLLTREADAATNVSQFNFSALYPYTLILMIGVTLIIGIITARKAFGYIRVVKNEADVYYEADKLITDEIRHELECKLTVKDLSFLTLLISLTPIFLIEIRSVTSQQINLMPAFLFGGITLFAAVRLKKHLSIGAPVFAVMIIGTVSSLVKQITEGIFLDTHGYTALTHLPEAKSAYIATIITASIEAVCCTALVIAMTVLLMRLIVKHAGMTEDADTSSGVERDRHKSLNAQIIVWCIGGCVLQVIRLLNVIFKYFSRVRLVSTGEGVASITMNLLPWFGSVMFLATAAYVLYSVYTLSKIKDEIAFNYDQETA